MRLQLLLILLVAFSGQSLVAQEYWNTTCGTGDPILNSLVINACCSEDSSEYITFQTGTNPFVLNVDPLSIEVDVPGHPTQGNPVNVWSANTGLVATLNGLLGACGTGDVFVDPFSAPHNGTIPPNAIVWAFFRNPSDIDCYLDLANLCGSQDIFVVFGNYNGMVPLFLNTPSCGSPPCYRPVNILLGGCTHNIQYDPAQFSDLDGDNISQGLNNTVVYNDGTGTGDCAPQGIFCTDPPMPDFPDDTLFRCSADPPNMFPQTNCTNCLPDMTWFDQNGVALTPQPANTPFPPDLSYYPSPSGETFFIAQNFDGICTSDPDTIHLITELSPPASGALRCAPGGMISALPCDPICPGDSVTLAFLSGFTGPYNMVLTDGTSNDTITVTSSPFFFDVGPFSQSVTLEVISLFQGNCERTPAGLLMQNITVAQLDTTYITDGSCNPADTGSFNQVFMGFDGCDSTVISNISYWPSTTSTINQTTCDINSVGMMIDTFTAANTCDSIVIVDITYDPLLVDSTIITSTTCNPLDSGSVVVTLTGSDGCDSVVITTTTLLPIPTAADVTIDTCDVDITANFDLVTATAAVVTGQTGVTVTYHGSMSDATNGMSPLPNPYMNTVNPEIIYARVENTGGCFAVSMVTLQVNLNPVLSGVFADCASDLQSYTISFFSTVDSITASGGYTVTPVAANAYEIAGVTVGQSIDITLVDPLTGCSYAETVMSPICDCGVVMAPISNGDTSICESAAIPSLSVTLSSGHQGYWYDVPAGGMPIDSGASYTPLVSNVGSYTYYVESVDTMSACASDTRTAITLNILAAPSADNASLEVCATSTTGSFDLTLADDAVLNGQSGMSVSYHLTIDDANNDVNALASPYTNTSNGQVIFARVENAAGCYAVSEVVLQVNTIPWIMITDQNCSADLLTYSIDLLTDADSISVNGNYPITNNGGGFYTIDTIPTGTSVTLYFVITLTGCQDSLVVSSPDCSCDPVSSPVSLGDTTICEGSAVPVLAVEAATDIAMNWYDAPAGGTILHTGETYQPTVSAIGSYTYYVEALNLIDNCTSITRTAITLQIVANPVANAASIVLCDDDGQASVDLTQADAQVLGGQAGLVVQYYSTLTEAQDDINPLPNPYTTSLNQQTIYARVTDGNGCYATAAVDITVNIDPDVQVQSVSCAGDLLSYTVALQTDGDSVVTDGGHTVINTGGGLYEIVGVDVQSAVVITIFNTTTGCATTVSINPPDCDCDVVAPPVSLGDTTICLSTGLVTLEVEAVNGVRMDWYDVPSGGAVLDTGALFLPNQTMQGVYTYYVEAVDIVTNCVSALRTAVTLTINENPQANNAQMTLCGNGTTNFDLNTIISDITAGQAGVVVTFHETVDDANNDQNPLTIPYENTSNPQVIYSRVTNGFGCHAVGFVTLEVRDGGAVDSFYSTTCDPASAMTSLDTFVAGGGCDSIVFNQVELTPSFLDTIAQFTCDMSNVGVFTDSLQTIAGCDSIVVRNVVFDADAVDSMMIANTTCDPSQAGIVRDTFAGADGCDSIIITVTTLTPSFRDTVQVFSCDMGQVGFRADTFSTVADCDSIIVTNTIFDANATDSTLITAETCDVTQVGVVRDTLMNGAGCDSIIITTTTLSPSTRDTVALTTCDMTQVGTMADTLMTTLGCDSIIVTRVSFDPAGVDSSFMQEITCDPAQVGITRDTIMGTDGCDSILITEYIFGTQTDTTIRFTCDMTQVGISRDTFLLPNVCDSIAVTITQFEAGSVDSSYTQRSSCNMANVGIARDTVTGSDGCDSMVIVETIFQPILPDTIMSFTCNPGSVWFAADTARTSEGCDSIVVTQTLFDPDAVDTTYIQDFTCLASDTGTFYEMYMDQFGCDSVVARQYDLYDNTAPTFVTYQTCDENLVGTDTTIGLNQFGCEYMIIRTYVLGDYIFSLDPGLSTIFGGDSVQLTLVSSTIDFSAVSIQWTPSTGLSCDTCISTWASPLTATTYQVTVSDTSGCSAAAEASVVISSSSIYVPNAFSPNNDQINDVFTAYSDRPVLIESINIFNRWGGKVFSQKQVQLDNFRGWDGTVNGEEAETGVYVYAIKAIIDGQDELITGDMTLVR